MNHSNGISVALRAHARPGLELLPVGDDHLAGLVEPRHDLDRCPRRGCRGARRGARRVRLRRSTRTGSRSRRRAPPRWRRSARRCFAATVRSIDTVMSGLRYAGGCGHGEPDLDAAALRIDRWRDVAHGRVEHLLRIGVGGRARLLSERIHARLRSSGWNTSWTSASPRHHEQRARRLHDVAGLDRARQHVAALQRDDAASARGAPSRRRAGPGPGGGRRGRPASPRPAAPTRPAARRRRSSARARGRRRGARCRARRLATARLSTSFVRAIELELCARRGWSPPDAAPRWPRSRPRAGAARPAPWPD